MRRALRGACIAMLFMAAMIVAVPTSAGVPADLLETPPVNLPVGWHKVQGRTVTISLPYRSAEYWLWVGATEVSDQDGFAFVNLDIELKAGPEGTDLAVFTYVARLPATATLRFGLVPAGTSIVGPPKTRHFGSIAKTYVAVVTAQ